MYKYSIIVEQEDNIYIAKNLELGIVSQGNSYEESLVNMKEATLLFLEGEDENEIISSVKNKNYSLTNIVV